MSVLSAVERMAYLAAIVVLVLFALWTTYRTDTAVSVAVQACESNGEAERTTLVDAVGRWRLLADDAVAEVKSCRDKWTEVGNRIDLAMANHSQAAADLQKAMDGFTKKWFTKSGQCTLALAQMEEACKTDIPSY